MCSARQINVVYFIDNVDLNSLIFYLSDKTNRKIPLSKFIKINQNVAYITLISDEDLSLGNEYLLMNNDGEKEYLDYEEYFDTKDFVEKYSYDGDDLGCTYSKDSSTFKVYSPLASKMMLKIEKNESTFILLEMKRSNCGVFSTTVKGDMYGKRYSYVAHINGRQSEFRDPYGKGMALNSEYSAVVDLNQVLQLGTVECPIKTPGNKDKIIYEVDIRDFTGKETPRPTYGSFVEKIPYLVFMGITYVQLQPVLDFDNVDDLTIDTYNWGYDPLSFFSLEGSYSQYPEDPHSRMIEFKNLVNELHKAGIKVILDVVYNHVYEYRTSDFEKSFPGYYFRKNNNKLCNGSGCGNDFASERFMGGKLIRDSLKFLTEVYDVDGFRFDLMGLIDLKTCQKFSDELKAIKPEILLYGEGWDMMTKLPFENKACSGNAKLIPNIGFFNAGFRDLIKGNTFDKNSRGYGSGDLSHLGDVENVLLGSYLWDTYVNASQSINYVECHDNQTLFDKLTPLHKDSAETLERVKFINALTILSLGIPLIHMGQEIGQSKFGLDNTYNIKNVNDMDWSLLKERYDMVKYLSDLITLRTSHDIFNLKSRDEISNAFDIYQYPSGLMSIKIRDEKYLYGNKEIIVLINPTANNITHELDDYYLVYFTVHGFAEQEIMVKNLLLSRSSLRILVKK